MSVGSEENDGTDYSTDTVSNSTDEDDKNNRAATTSCKSKYFKISKENISPENYAKIIES